MGDREHDRTVETQVGPPASRATATVAAVAAVIVVAGVLGLGGARLVPAAAQTGPDDSTNAGSAPGRVRPLVYRWRSLDGSERVTEGGEETTVTLAADVLFEFDQASLGPEAEAVMAEVAGGLADLGPRTVTITGHTDSRGDDGYNQTLSEQRAATVRDALASQLGGQLTFEVSGQGESQPVAPNEHDDGSDDPEGRAVNRRVEIRYPNG